MSNENTFGFAVKDMKTSIECLSAWRIQIMCMRIKSNKATLICLQTALFIMRLQFFFQEIRKWFEERNAMQNVFKSFITQ